MISIEYSEEDKKRIDELKKAKKDYEKELIKELNTKGLSKDDIHRAFLNDFKRHNLAHKLVRFISECDQRVRVKL